VGSGASVARVGGRASGESPPGEQADRIRLRRRSVRTIRGILD
jgi:hypothetical protein